jgi:mono/diheme cytochrome c family protein
MASLTMGCSSSDDSSSPRPSGSSGQTSSGLSLAFASRCARCHGTTATGQGIYPALPGKLTAAEFSATVRSGRDQMPSFDTGQISDADLTADYTWMTTKR